MNAMERIAPEIIILARCNDIDATDAHTLRVGMDLFQLASKLNDNHGLRRGEFCQLRKRWRHVSVEGVVGPRCWISMSFYRQLVHSMIVSFTESTKG